MKQSPRVDIPPDAILRTTGQMWKIVIAGLVLPLPTTFLSMWLIRRIGTDQSTAEFLLGTAALILAAALIVVLLRSVRCPRCGMRWIRRILAESDAVSALTGFLNMRSCPQCGFGAVGS